MEERTKDLRATRRQSAPKSDKIPLWQVLVTSGVAIVALVSLVVFLYGFWKHVR